MKMSDLSEQEKKHIQELWSHNPRRRTTSGDADDPTLGLFEESVVRNLRQKEPDVIFGDPVGRCDQLRYIALGKDFPFQNLYCANCGTELKKLEDDNFEMVCDCGTNGKKYDFDLITFDPNEHIRRKQLKENKENDL